jgi:hypothetical protein
VVHRTVLVLILLWAGLFVFNSLTRARHFSPDGMNYVDVADNIAAGRGVTQSVLGYNQPYFPVNEDLPTPFTVHAPLYPLAIAAVTRLGLSGPDGALVVSALAFALLLAVAYRLASLCYGRAAALLAVAMLLVYGPLVGTARSALAEAPGLLFLLLGLFLLTRECRRPFFRWPVALATGLCFGLAFAARYALAPSLPVGLLALGVYWHRRGEGWRKAVSDAGLLAVGFAAPAAPILARNLILTRTLMGEGTLPITLSPSAAMTTAFHSLAGHYSGTRLPSIAQELLLGGLLLALALGFVWRRRLISAAKASFVTNGAYALTLWALGYLAFVVYARTRTYFNLDPRTVLPAGVALVMLLAGFAAAGAGRRAPNLVYVALVLVGVGLFREARLAAGPPAPTVEQVIAGSDRLRWVAGETTDRDLLAGVNTTLDLPFYLGRTGVLFFHCLPAGEPAEYDTLRTWVGRHRARYDRVFFLLPVADLPAAELRRTFGPFVADLVAGNTSPYPGIRLHRRLADALVFQVE